MKKIIAQSSRNTDARYEFRDAEELKSWIRKTGFSIYDFRLTFIDDTITGEEEKDE